MKYKYVICLSLILSSCNTNKEKYNGLTSLDTLQIVVTDTIGIEIGDPNYMFGNIVSVQTSAEFLFVLDRAYSSIRQYTWDGEYVRTLAQRGEGPGELINPYSMALIDGRIIVSSPGNGGTQTYNTEGEWLGITEEYTRNPYLNMQSVSNDQYIAQRIEVDYNNADTIYINTQINGLSGAHEVLITDKVAYSPTCMTEVLNKSIFGYRYAVGDEQIYVANTASTMYNIIIYNNAGDSIYNYSRADIPSIGRSQEEMNDEKVYVEYVMGQYATQGIEINYDPREYRNPIEEMGVDSSNHLWVRRGIEDYPYFDVYNSEMEQLFIAIATGIDSSGEKWRILVTKHGMIAYSENPQIVQRIYILKAAE